MDKVGKLLGRVLSRQPDSARFAELRLALVFREMLGPELASACESVVVRGGTVSVVTGNPALAHQLRLEGPRLIERLNSESRLGRRVKDLRVRTGR